MSTDPDKKQATKGRSAPRVAAPQSELPGGSPRKAPDRPWKPAVITDDEVLRKHPGVLHKSEVMALHACWHGTANADQQRRAILAIHKIACTGDMSYRPDSHGGDRDSVFAEGKRYVGLQMQKLIDHHSLFVQDIKKTT